MYSTCVYVPKPQFVPGLLAKSFHHKRLEAAVDEAVLQRTQINSMTTSQISTETVLLQQSTQTVTDVLYKFRCKDLYFQCQGVH